LGLSARELALLLGVSQLSVYKWEQGKARPRAKQLQAISQLRRLGKKDVAAWVNQLED
jgi:transcriptional regulator with XRE-family HTH domain